MSRQRPEHEIGRPERDPDGFVRLTCACGWSSPPRRYGEQTVPDGSQHVLDVIAAWHVADELDVSPP